MKKALRAAALVLVLGVPGAVLHAQSAAQPGALPLCVPDDHTLCLDGARFKVTAGYQQSESGPITEATAVTLTDATGYFWFFDSSNVELIVKVLDGCPVNGHYWVFAAGLTNVGVTLAVTDMRTGVLKTYNSTVGTPFAPIQDTGAFSTCP